MERLARRERISQSAVEHVTNDRRAQVPRMHADLMRSPSVEPALDEAHRAGPQTPLGKFSEYRARRATAVTANHSHSDSLGRISPDRLINLYPIRCVALHQRQIATAHPARSNLIGKMSHGGFSSGHHHQTAGVLVQPMNDPSTRQGGLAHEAIEEAVQQGAVPVTRTRMHHQSGVFVDHKDRIVIVGKTELNGFRRKRSVSFQRLHFDQ